VPDSKEGGYNLKMSPCKRKSRRVINESKPESDPKSFDVFESMDIPEPILPKKKIKIVTKKRTKMNYDQTVEQTEFSENFMDTISQRIDEYTNNL
jgi:hypothetical protein